MAQILDKSVGPIGFGLMGLTWRPDPIPVEDAIAALKMAAESGATLWNGAEFYGTPEYNSMTLLKHYFTKYPEDADKITIVIKGGCDLATLVPQGSPDQIRRSIDSILEQLGGKKKLDVFGLGRRDPKTSLADTLLTIQREYIDTGKIGGVSLSECSAATIEEASQHVRVAGAEVEVSMFTQDTLSNGVAAACAKHNIPIIAYSPMGRGILTGRFQTSEDSKYLGRIGGFPRFQDDALQHNLKLVERVQSMAQKKGCTAAQLALAWVRSLSKRPGLPSFIPIPGSTTPSRVQQNSKAVELSEDELREINGVLDGFEIAGPRYPPGVPTEL